MLKTPGSWLKGYEPDVFMSLGKISLYLAE